MVAALADFNLVTTVVLGLRARKCRLYPGDKYRMACIAHHSWDGVTPTAQLRYCTAVVRSGLTPDELNRSY